MLLIDVSGSMMGNRIKGATQNAVNIYEKFTDDKDHVGLIHFHHATKVKMALQPRRKDRTQMAAQLDIIKNTMQPEWGGTAFYDAIINAIKTPVCARTEAAEQGALAAPPTPRGTRPLAPAVQSHHPRRAALARSPARSPCRATRTSLL